MKNDHCLINFYANTFSSDDQSLSNSIEGGTKWLVNKIKGLCFISISYSNIHPTSVPVKELIESRSKDTLLW